jgi:hypothetical protein
MNNTFQQALKKGDIGENIVKLKLEKHGWICYKVETDGSHPLDKFAIKNNKIIALDIKTKAKRNKYDDTGIDERLYKLYKDFSTKNKIEFYVIFVDEVAKKVYGNKLTELDEPIIINNKKYPSIEKCKNGVEMRYWAIKNMKYICNISDEDVKKIKDLEQRNYDYLD